MKTVRELVVETQLEVQRLAGHKRDTLLDDKILWRLNSAQDFVIKSSLRPKPKGEGFEVTQEGQAEIQKLITANYFLPVFKETSTRSFSIVPPNFGYLLNDRSSILTDCSNGFDTASESITYTIYIIPFNDSSLTSPNYYKTIGLAYNSGVLNINITGLKSIEEKFELIEFIMSKIDAVIVTPQWKTYYESYKDFYYPGCFLVVGENGIPSLDLIIDGVTIPKTTVTLTENRYKNIGIDEASNRNYKGDSLYDAIYGNYYDLPFPESPISQLANNRIYVFNSKRFLVSGINIDYIRKPRRISLSLNQSCELDSNVHKKVCSIAAEMLLSDLEASNYKTKTQENLTRT